MDNRIGEQMEVNHRTNPVRWAFFKKLGFSIRHLHFGEFLVGGFAIWVVFLLGFWLVDCLGYWYSLIPGFIVGTLLALNERWPKERNKHDRHT